jgi:hypothetical protein
MTCRIPTAEPVRCRPGMRPPRPIPHPAARRDPARAACDCRLHEGGPGASLTHGYFAPSTNLRFRRV